MDSITKNVTLGFYDEIGTYTIYAKQRDSGRSINLIFANEIEQYILQDFTYVYFIERFSDGTVFPPVQVENISIDEDSGKMQSILNLTSAMLAIPGISDCEIQIIRCDDGMIPEFDENGYLVNENYTILSTASFKIYIESSISSTGSLTLTEQDLLNQITPLIVGAQQMIDHDAIYTANEEVRVENEEKRVDNELERVETENIRIENEDERSRAEQERRAYEGHGNYTDPQDISYVDIEGNPQTIRYQDSRRGYYERIIALNDGGSYIDEDGEVVVIKNSYTNDEGEEIVVTDPSYGDMSYRAYAEYIKYLSQIVIENAQIAKSYARGGTGTRPGEDEDNALYYAQKSKDICDSLDGSIKPMGPSTLDALPIDPQPGWQYQITEKGETDDRFIEGAGIEILPGDLVYYTTSGKWSIFVGNLVRGVKGEKEDEYRLGEVSLSPADIGAIPDVSEDAMIGQTIIFDGDDWVPGDSMPEGLLDGNVQFTDIMIGTRDTIIYQDNPFTLSNGEDVSVIGYASHAEGQGSWTQGDFSHAEGKNTSTGGNYSHAEGVDTTANGEGSHAAGKGTLTSFNYQSVIGSYNKNKSDNIFEIGNGTADNARHNAFEIDKNGYIQTAEGAKIKFGKDSSGAYGYYDESGTFTRFGKATDGVVLPINPSPIPTEPGSIWIST